MKHLSEYAHSEGLDVEWKNAYAALLEARQRYTEPMLGAEDARPTSFDEEARLLRASNIACF